MKKKFKTRQGNYVEPAKSKFCKGVPGKNGPSHNIEIPEKVFKKEVERLHA